MGEEAVEVLQGVVVVRWGFGVFVDGDLDFKSGVGFQVKGDLVEQALQWRGDLPEGIELDFDTAGDVVLDDGEEGAGAVGDFAVVFLSAVARILREEVEASCFLVGLLRRVRGQWLYRGRCARTGGRKCDGGWIREPQRAT